ncbi:MAG TPA: hypothetical protein VGN74_05550 [Brevundimonas sp.]|jgi:hypothetical protein|uniref:hypothetical protein n=1 Tax=Brevundimonas sp. TaxID=1871086 RepID=UPI002E16376F|nr:hypothetical protein [Brevundimonas sp.]
MALNWTRAKPLKPSDAARPVGAVVAGAWTHTKRQPARVMSPEERAAFLASRPDLR